MHRPKLLWLSFASCGALIAVVVSIIAVSPAGAQDATWLTNPGSGAFNTGANWSPATVPTGIASFGASNTTTLTFSTGTTVGSLLFNSGASAYTFNVGGQSLSLTNGLTNNASQAQTFTATAGGTIQFDGGSARNSLFSVSGAGAQLNFYGTSNAGTSTITASGGAALNVDDSADMASSTVTISGTGTTMCFCNNANPNAMTVTVNTGATLSFEGNNASNTMRYIGGGGTFDLSAMGVASVAIGSIEGSGSIDLGANNLTAGANNMSTNYSGAISGTGGSFTKTGSGMLTLSGANTFTGLTTVSGGTLNLTGSLAGGASVSSGGTFMGTGTMGGSLTNSGIVAPGTSVGTLTVSGNFTQNSGGTYQVEVNGSQSDRINVTGTASLAGGVSVSAPSGSYLLNTAYTILNTTGGRTGAFSSATGFGLVRPILTYDANNVFMTLSLASNGFQSVAQNSNQAAVGRVLDQSAATATGDFNTVISAIAGLNTSQIPGALSQISGQNYSGFSTVAVQSAQVFMNNFSQQTGGGSTGGTRVSLAQKSDSADCGIEYCELPLARWGAWGGGVGGAGTVAGNANAPGTSYSLGGFAAGLDYRFDPRFLGGVTVGYTNSNQYTQTFAGTGRSNTFQFGFYGTWSESQVYVDALAGYAYSSNRMWRPISFPGVQRTAQGNAGANQFFGQLEGGYGFLLGGEADGKVTPFARLQGSTSTQNGFTETGADSLNLTVAQQTTNSLRSVLGTQLTGTIARMDWTFRLGWSHEFADTDRPVTASFAGAPALGFATNGATAPRDGAIVGLGTKAMVGEQTSLYARYDGDIAGGNTAHIFSAGLRMVW